MRLARSRSTHDLGPSLVTQCCGCGASVNEGFLSTKRCFSCSFQLTSQGVTVRDPLPSHACMLPAATDDKCCCVQDLCSHQHQHRLIWLMLTLPCEGTAVQHSQHSLVALGAQNATSGLQKENVIQRQTKVLVAAQPLNPTRVPRVEQKHTRGWLMPGHRSPHPEHPNKCQYPVTRRQKRPRPEGSRCTLQCTTWRCHPAGCTKRMAWGGWAQCQRQGGKQSVSAPASSSE